MSASARLTGNASWPHANDLNFFTGRLDRGAVYAVGIETVAARGLLWQAPLRAALTEERPGVLITPLDPAQPTFAAVVERAAATTALAEAFAQGRLQLFTADGDHAAALFRRGAAGYVGELDHFGIADGSLLLIDQADDLFTPHDHVAVVEQARIYEDWARRHGHTLLLLFLRASAHRPILEGNQAALQHCRGVARVTPEADRLCLLIDFWQSPAGQQIGQTVWLDSVRGTPAAPASPLPAPGRGLPPSAERLAVWHLGMPDGTLDALSAQVQWRCVDSIEELPASGSADAQRARVLVAPGASLDGATLLRQLQALRAHCGEGSRILLRESGHRLREHGERRWLRAAGVDAVIDADLPLSDWLPLLRGDAAGVADGTVAGGLEPAQAEASAALAALLAEADQTDAAASGWLACDDFVAAARELLQRCTALGVPCTLAEVTISDADLDEAAALRASRGGDLALRRAGELLFLLQGCDERDAILVVTRRMAEAGAGRAVRRVSLFYLPEAIDERLAELTEADDAGPAPTREGGAPIGGSVGGNVVAMHGRSGSRGLTGSTVALSAAVALALLPWPAPTQAQTRSTPPKSNPVQPASARKAAKPVARKAMAAAPSASGPAAEAAPTPRLARATGAAASGADGAGSPPPISPASQAYDEARYAEAGQLGLVELQTRPGDHDLRLKVANALAWTGDYARAVPLYEALAGTRLANAGRLGLANIQLWNGQPQRAAPLLRQVVAAEPDHSEARASLADAEARLRPRSTLQLGRLSDSGQARRSALQFGHGWWAPDLAQRFELNAELRHETKAPEQVDEQAREIGLSWEHQRLPLAPRVELSVQQAPRSRWFIEASAQLGQGWLGEQALGLRLGRVNWGKLAFSPVALRDGLSAQLVGLTSRGEAAPGQWDAQWSRYAISDGNQVTDASLRFTPAWQPLPAASGLRLFAGLASHKARQASASYWSPTAGHSVAQFGATWGRWERDWDLSAELRRSQRLAGEGANGWSGSIAGKRAIGRDLALRAEASHDSTRRGTSSYRATALSLALERLW